MGVSMLPRLAATVCSTTTQMSSRFRSARIITATAKGTKVMRATSLVMSMELKKHSPTRMIPMMRTLEAVLHRVWAMWVNSRARRRPETATMRQYSSARVRQSI